MEPDIIFLVDSEIWPNLIFNAKKDIPINLINARITKKHFLDGNLFQKQLIKFSKSLICALRQIWRQQII